MKSTVFTLLLVLSFIICHAQDTKPGPQPPPETGETFKVGVAGNTFVRFDLDKTLETLKALDVHYLCIKDFHLPMNSTDAEIAAFHEKLKAHDVTGYLPALARFSATEIPTVPCPTTSHRAVNRRSFP